MFKKIKFKLLNKFPFLRRKHKIGACGAICFETKDGAICAECGKRINEK